MDAQGQAVWVFQVYYRRLLIALALLATAGWLLAASALFLWLDHAPHNQVGWLDLAAPWRWAGLQTKRGDAAVLQALDELKAHEYTDAFYSLRVGLARSPGNVDGRLILARLELTYEPARAVSLLEEGLPYSGNDPKLLGGLLAVYSSLQMPTRALEVVSGLLQAQSPVLSPEARFMLQRAQVTLLLQLERYPEAEAALAAIHPPVAVADQESLQALRIEWLLRSGRAAEAKRFSDGRPAGNPADPAHLRQEAEIAIALEDSDALQSVLRHLKARAPEDPGAYLYAFQAWQRMKRLSLRDAAEQEYYRAFGGSDAAVQALAALAVNLDLPEVVARAQRAAVAAGHSPFAYRVHQTELALRRGETEQATRLLRDWENNIDTLKSQQRFYPEFIKRLTRAAFAGTPDQIDYLLAHLNAHREQAQLPVQAMAVTVLEKSGYPAGASLVLRAALQKYPRSDPLLAAQKLLDEPKAKASATPATTAAAAAGSIRPLPPTAAAARQQLDGLMQEDSLASVRDLIRAIRVRKPAWLPAVEADISLHEVELAFLTLDQIAARTAARTYLDRYRGEEPLLRLATLVPQLIRRGRATEARLLRDEIASASDATARVRLALENLNLADDLAAAAAKQMDAMTALDGWILAQEWAQAERFLKYLQDRPPAWLPDGQTELKVREVEVRLGLDQRPMVLAALKDLVIKGGVARSAAFKLVRDKLARGEGESAAILAREIARLLPGDPAAERLVKEAEAPRPADK